MSQTVIRGILERIDDSLDHRAPIPVITPCVWTSTCDHPIKRGFTSEACSALRGQYPDYAVFVYHNTNSVSCKIGDYITTHYELNLMLGFTYGYEVLLMKQGWFELAGDGGDLNFCTDSDPEVTPVVLDGDQYVVDGAQTVCEFLEV
jgi:hypothetical protein